MIKMFIGTSANGEDTDAEMVYEYSLRKNCSEELDITWMRQTRNTTSPWGGWSTSMWSTPFSGFRWAIPEVCGFKGRAIYTDVDMINFRDINDMFTIDMEGKPLAARRGRRFGGHEFCVMLFDNAKMEQYLTCIDRMKSIPETHHRMIKYFSGNESLVYPLDPRWNCLDGEGLPISDIWHLHFTTMATQPWQPAWFTGQTAPHPRQDLVNCWYDLREEAKDSIAFKKTNRVQETFGQYDIIGR